MPTRTPDVSSKKRSAPPNAVEFLGQLTTDERANCVRLIRMLRERSV